MYTKFSKIIGVKYDPQTGDILPESEQEFLTMHTEMVSDLGSGFYGKNTWDPTVVSSDNQTIIHSYADEQIDRFLQQLEQGLQMEIGK